MSYDDARDTLVALIESAMPTKLSFGFPKTFKHFPEASEATRAPTRGFRLWAAADDVRKPLIGRRRHQAKMRLEVFYDRPTDAALFDQVLRADYKAISGVLLDPSRWASASSGLTSVEASAGVLALHADVEERSKRVVHVYKFDMEYVA